MAKQTELGLKKKPKPEKLGKHLSKLERAQLENAALTGIMARICDVFRLKVDTKTTPDIFAARLVAVRKFLNMEQERRRGPRGQHEAPLKPPKVDF